MELLRRRSDEDSGDEVSRIFQNLQDKLEERLADITDLHQRQAAQLDAYREFFQSIANLSQAGEGVAFFKAAVRAPLALLELTSSAICVIDPEDEGRLIPVAHEQIDLDDPEDLVFKITNPIIKALQVNGKTLAMADLVGKAGPRSRKRSALRRLGLELAVPLQDSDQFYGILFLTNRADGEPFTKEQDQLLDDFAVLLTLALKSHALHETTIVGR